MDSTLTINPTPWTAIRHAFTREPDPTGNHLREKLAEKYREFAFKRLRHLTDRETAEDLAQSFFQERFMAEDWQLPRNAEPAKGKFRALLRVALGRHWQDHLDHINAKKRGGQFPHEEFDSVNESVSTTDPNFERAWIKEEVETICRIVKEEECLEEDGERIFAACLKVLSKTSTYREQSEQLGLPQSTFQGHVNRVLQRLRTVAETAIITSHLDPTEENFHQDWGTMREAWEEKAKNSRF